MAEELNKNKLRMTVAPHLSSPRRSSHIMALVLFALMPAVIISIYGSGVRGIMQYGISICACIVFESIFNAFTGRKSSVGDLSAVVTGVLLAMNIPVSLPLSMTILGAFVAIIVAKMVFGGLGCNPFNPALTARVFLLISFPAYMTNWNTPDSLSTASPVDTLSGATLLGVSKEYIKANNGSLEGFKLPDFVKTMLDMSGGSLGETFTIALILGGLFLIAVKVISWHIPIAFIGTVFIFTAIINLFSPGSTIPAHYHLTSGGLMLGAFFMATDYSSSLIIGKIIFGIGCGLLTVLIRVYGGYPEGVAFSILIMNALTPLLDRYLRPRIYGEVTK